jgi:hypothetical protein
MALSLLFKQIRNLSILSQDYSLELVLPKFKTLECIKTIQSAAGNKPEGFQSWHEALHYMKDEMSKKEFDVALIGCGAFTL